MYECDELHGFIRECINRMETMPPERVEETLMGFIRKSVYTHMYYTCWERVLYEMYGTRRVVE